MKHVIVLDGIKARECLESLSDSHQHSPLTSSLPERLRRCRVDLSALRRWMALRSLPGGIISGFTAFISVCLSMHVAASVFSIICMLLLWVADSKGGKA